MKRILLPILLLASLPSLGANYRVGPTQPYKTLQEVADLLIPGDTVTVDGGVAYPGDIVFTRPGSKESPIRILGMPVDGHRPVLEGGTNTVTFSTPWPYDQGGADHYILEGFEVAGGSFRGIFHQADDLTLRDVIVRDCPAHGILGADEGSGSLVMEGCEVYRCGSGDSRHQIYVATDEVNHPGSVFRMQNCFVHDGNGGNNIKSRAERNEIFYNWVEGAYYHELELIGPDGGDGGNPSLKREDSDVVGNVLWKRQTAAGNDPNFSVTRVGGDGTGETFGRYRFVNNTILCGTGSVFRIFDGIESIEMHNNVLAPIAAGPVKVKRTAEANWATGQEVIVGSNNWVASGAEEVPAQWSGTLYGAQPGFADAASRKLRPGEGSPLCDAGTSAPQPPAGFPFPEPLFPPAFDPPEGISPGNAVARGIVGPIDIGAFERGTGTAPPSILSFVAEPATILQGCTSVLRWSVTGAVGLLLDPGGVDATGTSEATVTPAATTAYTLTATGPGGTTDASVTVTVTPWGSLCVDDDNLTGVEDGTPFRPFRALQAAVDAAPSAKEIRVAAGSYPTCALIENKALRIFGGFVGGNSAGYASGVPGDFGTRASDPATTHLAGTLDGAVLTFRRTTTVIGTTEVDGFRITNGTRGILLDGEYPSGDFSDFAIVNNIIEDNGPPNPDPASVGGGICAEGTTILIAGNTIRNNRAGMGAGIGRSATGWAIEDNLIEGNVGAGDHGGGLWLAGSGTVSGNIIRGNRVGDAVGYGWGGGVLMVGEFTFCGNTVSENQAPTLGGGVFVDEGADVLMDHDLIVKNRTLEEWVKGGAGVYVDSAWNGTPSVAHIENCTVAENVSPGSNGGNGVFVEGSDVWVRDCIFWGNSGGDDFFLEPTKQGSLSVAYTLSQETWPGEGNFIADPLFADPASQNFRLRSKAGRWQDTALAWVTDPEQSPAIDAADPASAWNQEPEPNGGRRNLGFDGNTPYASKSRVGTCVLACSGSAAPASGIAPLTVNFEGSAEVEGCTEDPAFLWHFGDGTLSPLRSPSHRYSIPGLYPWTLEVSVPGVVCTQTGTVTATAPTPLPGDCDGDGAVSIGEVQRSVNMFLGLETPACGVDCGGDGAVSIGEVQRVINAFLGLASSC